MGDGCWIVGGYLNLVVCKEERKGVGDVRRDVEMVEFKTFIEDMNLIGVASLRGMFTWINYAGYLMSRLDRFLLSDNVFSNWNIVGKIVGSKDISNHCLVWLKASNFN